MSVEINGTASEVTDGTTLLELIESHAGTTRGSAVVVDGTVVPRSDWPHYRVADGQRIELITAVQGG
ncbi:MAG TPA: sulfur carrier protein ThiS [Jatrophihabitantaceae bacterium]|jgi:sulfur carrier protein|nr:sulfur carrier protein ThiS [Jatrophihabitantaceae bacterium]